MSGVTVGGNFFKYDCQEIDLRLTAKGLTEDDLKELGEAMRLGRFRRLKKLNLVSICRGLHSPPNPMSFE
jgi:hypothetical protein